jgi:diguanylate cyclase (GGDEF)-like protein
METKLDRIIHLTKSLDKRVVMIICIAMILALGYADYSSGFEFAFSLFYLFPVCMIAWFVNRQSGLLLSAFSAIIWFISNKLAGESYSQPIIGFWNAGVRFGFFAITTFLLTSLRESLHHERELSRTDHVTGLTNSRAFYQQATTEILRAGRYDHPFTVVYFDLDNFKQINDQMGHHAGDEVLRVIAGTLKSNLRQTDIAARLGGDEFVILFPELNDASARAAIKKLKTSLQAAMELRHWEITFSIGVITFTNFSFSIDQVIQKVDEIMYTVKANGKDNIQFAIQD